MNELRVTTNLYLELKDGETEEQAKERLYDILYKIEGLTLGDWLDSEMQYNN